MNMSTLEYADNAMLADKLATLAYRHNVYVESVSANCDGARDAFLENMAADSDQDVWNMISRVHTMGKSCDALYDHESGIVTHVYAGWEIREIPEVKNIIG